jgi:hypothetical protein
MGGGPVPLKAAATFQHHVHSNNTNRVGPQLTTGETMSNQPILVIGATGKTGSRVAAKLEAKGV